MKVVLFILIVGLLAAPLKIIYPQLLYNNPAQIAGFVSDYPVDNNSGQSFHVNGLKIFNKSNQKISFGDYIIINDTKKTNTSIIANEISQKSVPLYSGALSLLTSFRTRLISVPVLYLPKRSAEIVLGMVLGQKQSDQKLYQALVATGTIHILVVSGANLSMLASVLLRTKDWIGKRKSFVFTIVFIWFYVVLTGMQPPVLRAAFMVTLAYFGQLLGRQAWPFYGLLLACSILLFFNPGLITDTSFQLSVSATAGIILLSKPIEKKLRNTGERLHIDITKVPFGFSENVATTVAAELFVNPLILWHFQQISLVSLFANVLVLPIVFYITVIGAIFIALGALIPFAAQAISYLLLLPCWYFIFVITEASRIPDALITISSISDGFIVCYYLFLTAWIARHANLLAGE